MGPDPVTECFVDIQESLDCIIDKNGAIVCSEIRVITCLCRSATDNSHVPNVRKTVLLLPVSAAKLWGLVYSHAPRVAGSLD